MGSEANGDELAKAAATRKFAVLLCAEESEYVRDVHGGYFAVFVRLLGEEGETWDAYRAARGELPTAEEVDAYDGFVITGSCSDAHGEDRWILDLVSFLRALDSKKKKVLGVCFGHQILCRALGGDTGRAKKGWDVGVTCIQSANSSAVRLFSSLGIPSGLPVIECHRDEVWRPPPHAEVMAFSERTGVEIFRCGDHVMGIQGHPEYNRDILLHLVDLLLQRDLVQTSQAAAARESLDAQEPDQEAWKRLCKGFLKSQLSW